MIDKAWCTDHDRGNFVLSIRCEPQTYIPFLPSVQQMKIKEKDVTTLGVFNYEDAIKLRDALDEFIDSYE